MYSERIVLKKVLFMQGIVEKKSDGSRNRKMFCNKQIGRCSIYNALGED